MTRKTVWTVLFLLASLSLAGCGESDDGDGNGDDTSDLGGDSGGRLDTGGLADADIGGGADAGGDAGGGGDTGGGGTGNPPVLGFSCPEDQQLVDGLNESFQVNGRGRNLYVDFPREASTGGTFGVLFMWHGLGDSAANFRAAIPVDPDGYPGFPIAVVTPDSLGLTPFSTPPGVPWTNLESAPGDDNIDVALFAAILGCLDAQYDIDTRRIYALGFSGGAIMTDLLHARFPDIIHTAVALSGAYFNNPETVDGVNTAGMDVNVGWADFPVASTGTILVSHGGGNDTFGLGPIEVIDFEASAQSDMEFLIDNSRTVIDCAHTGGHSPHPRIPLDAYINFFMDHPAGISSSPYWSDGLPAGLSGNCVLR